MSNNFTTKASRHSLSRSLRCSAGQAPGTKEYIRTLINADLFKSVAILREPELVWA